MKISHVALCALGVLCLLLVACGDATPTETILTPIATRAPTNVSAGAPASASTPAPTSAAVPEYCKNGGAITAAANEPLAAKVNGQPIPLGLYQRSLQQQQNTLTSQKGFDPKSKQGQDQLNALQEQTLGQLIDDVLVEQLAQAEHVSVTDQEVNSQIQQLINDAGSREKFDAYLKTTQISLDDYCVQIRASMFGDAMLAHVTAGMPTKVEQVHVAQILLATQADADKVLAQLKAGGDFAALAKQYSQDETSRNNGGDLGWFPKGMYPPEFDATAFQLQPGQTSGVIATALGFHIIKVLDHSAARDLDPMVLQNQQQQAFLAWLDAQRTKAKIEKFVNP